MDCRFYSAAAEELAILGDVRQVTDDTMFVAAHGKSGVARLVNVIAELGVDANVILDFDALDDQRTLKAIVAALGQDWTEELHTLYVSAAKSVSALGSAFWDAAKQTGLAAVPAGDAQVAFKALMTRLRACRVHVVPVGEVEGYYRDCGKSPEWLPRALTAGAHRSVDVQELICEVLPDLVRPDVR
jgi:hypothetical protein